MRAAISIDLHLLLDSCVASTSPPTSAADPSATASSIRSMRFGVQEQAERFPGAGPCATDLGRAAHLQPGFCNTYLNVGCCTYEITQCYKGNTALNRKNHTSNFFQCSNACRLIRL